MTDVLEHDLPFPEPGSTADAAFVGIGELPSGKFPDRTFMGALVEVSARAILDAGLSPRDIDTVLLIPCLHGGRDQADLIFSRLVEELGLNGRAKSSMMIHSGGSTSDSATRVAAGLIASGQARNVLIAQADRWGSAPVAEMVDMLSGFGIPREWEVPSGVTFNAVGGLITQRYMHATGSTPEEMASVCVALREWARLNPNAMFKDKELTVERVVSSRMISDPLHAMECPMLADGAVALVMTSASRARQTQDSWVRIAGSGGTVVALQPRSGARPCRDELAASRPGGLRAGRMGARGRGHRPGLRLVRSRPGPGPGGAGARARRRSGPPVRRRPLLARGRAADQHQRRAAVGRSVRVWAGARPFSQREYASSSGVRSPSDRWTGRRGRRSVAPVARTWTVK